MPKFIQVYQYIYLFHYSFFSLSLCFHLFLFCLKNTLSISFSVGILLTNSLSFVCLQVPLSSLKDIFAGYRILVWQLFSFSALKMLCCLLPSISFLLKSILRSYCCSFEDSLSFPMSAFKVFFLLYF